MPVGSLSGTERSGVRRAAMGPVVEPVVDDMKLDRGKSETALTAHVGKQLGLEPSLAALGVSEMVDENMANAARVHAMELGKTVEQYTLIAFGGAAPLHAARLAAKLGIARVIVPLNASVGSALGFLTAPVAFQAVRSWHAILNALDTRRANALLDDMQQQATDMVRAGAPGEAQSIIAPKTMP